VKLYDINSECIIGNTPLVRLSDKLFAKLETYNPTGSIKDRMAYYILSKAEEQSKLKLGDTIVEASSGNTGIAFAMLGAIKGYKVKIIMPCNMSEERKQMMRVYGAEIIEVGASDFAAAIALRDRICVESENHFAPRQFSNKYNIECHEKTTAQEILRDTWFYDIDAFVSGAGTGGTIMGIQRAFKKSSKGTKIIMMQPTEPAKDHGIQGVNDGEDFLVNKKKLDGIINIKTEEAKERAKRLAREHGLLVGISAGANVLASEKWIEKNNPDGIVVTILCDRGERYLSCL
tara:strand:+ start:3692 stop:4558 length:867 start_codon:yes stop_codon:yes gene_type:complete